MITEREKHPRDEVLFKWDPRGNFTSLGTSPGDNFIKRRMTNLDNSHKLINKLSKVDREDLNKVLRDSTTEGLNVRPESLDKIRDKRAELMKNLKKFQLHSCRDWLGTNTLKSSIQKVDTLDRLSSIIINPEFPIKHEAVLYSIQLGKSDLEFYNALYLTKLSRMSNPAVLELIRQPIFVRDRTLLLTDKKTCNCPLNAITKQQPTQRHFLPTMRPFSETQQPKQQGPMGDSLLNKFMSPHTNPMTPGLFSSDRNWPQTFLGFEKRSEAPKQQDDINDRDIVCPFHFPKDLPEQLKSPKGHSGYISDYNLLYRCEVMGSDNLLLLYELADNTAPNPEIYKYKLPSKLLAINSVYLKDFEFQRHYSYNLNDFKRANYSQSTMDSVNLSSVYTGGALFIATKTEFLICIPRYNENQLNLTVLAREKNHGHNIMEILSHKNTGRIFLLETNSLLYEYQYQLGFKPRSLMDNKVFKHAYGAYVYTKRLLSDYIRRNRVYSLTVSGTPTNNIQLTEQNASVSPFSTPNQPVYNCLEGLEKPIGGSFCYDPPLMWNEYGSSTSNINSNIFHSRDTSRSDCTCGNGCKKYKVNTLLRCINPWNKTYMKTSDSIGIIDQNRSIISLLNISTGDLSVFYIHGNTSLEEYNNSLEKGERVFPYDLTLYNLRHSNMMNTLERLGYGRYSHGTKFVKMISPPLNFVQGVDLILVDNLGTRVFIGFSNFSLITTSGFASVTSTLNPSDGATISAVNTKTSPTTNKLGLAVKGFRLQARHTAHGQSFGFPRGPFSLFRTKPNVSSFPLDDLLITMEPVRKNNNGTLIRAIVSLNDSTSFFQNYATLPISVNEEFYYFNEDHVRYKTVEENQPVEYYHEFYIKLGDKEKILSVNSENTSFRSESEFDSPYPPNRNANTTNVKEMNVLSPDKVTKNKIVIVTTEKVYKFNRLDLNLILKSLVKYTKNAVDLIKPPPILCDSYTSNNTHNTNSIESTVKDQDEKFNLSKYTKKDENGDGEKNYFISALKEDSIKLSKYPVNYSVNTTNSIESNTDMTEYMKYLRKKSEKNELVLNDIFGDDLVEVCENSKQLVGYSLYYLSWLYGPEILFKHLFIYLVELLKGCVLKEKFFKEDDNQIIANMSNKVMSNKLLDKVSNLLPTIKGFDDTVESDVIYKYILSSNLDDYNVFIGSFGIPSRIFNYVVPGCYSVLDHNFEKPVISPWCRFVSFSHNNKTKQSRVTTNTSPLVDGLLLLVSELLTPMYLNRAINLVPNLFTSMLINNVDELNYNPNKPSRVNYTLNGLVLDKFENENEFVVGSRVDMYLTTELSMGLESARKLLEQLNTIHTIALELVKNYQKCNLDNAVLLMSTLGPNVQKMILKPNVNQYEPYPLNTSFFSDVYATSSFASFYPTSTSGMNDKSLSVDTREAFKAMIKDRYENDLRTLKELVLVLEVSQEFLASCVLLHNSTVLGEYKYEFDKNLNLMNLLPSKTPNPFFSPSDYVLNSNKFVSPFNCKFTHESPNSKLVLTKDIVNVLSQFYLTNLAPIMSFRFLNKDVYKLFRIVVWLIGGDTSTLEKFFYGHIFTFDEITNMNKCNRIKYLERHFENTQDASKCEYLQSLIKQFTIN
ncbi:uncharacterized protein TA17630 [Theileria annulata]|uniref:Uncharacterized protein n=1 Tax=Theileria annulata TaxID=5874 RepID=Q4UBB5_THEAN|nr:uncharacterized protein TA17630 [Theileria annulata]CAI75886.1 hypothetical protein TA17630 [Theileria annulata]|eukprot:XP_955362.1 hypothetical protein TA17630 [Theileria annulata]